jgi:hypothetical protein
MMFKTCFMPLQRTPARMFLSLTAPRSSAPESGRTRTGQTRSSQRSGAAPEPVQIYFSVLMLLANGTCIAAGVRLCQHDRWHLPLALCCA